MTNRADELFARIETSGIAAIEEMIAEREAEELFLDFKNSADGGAGRHIADGDQKTLARAISGFGNSEGGVIVWGVDCRKDARGAEVATLAPLADAPAFRSRVESAISRLTTPPHALVRNAVALVEGGPNGCVATLIPKASFGPVRALSAGGDRYYLRAGDSFYPVPHDALAGLFGRPPKGDLWPQFLSRRMRCITPPDTAVQLSLQIGLYNPGPVLAERPYLSTHPLVNPSLGHNFILQSSDPNRAQSNPSPIGSFQIVSNETFVIAPGWMQAIGDLNWTLRPPVNGDIHLEVTVGAKNVEPRRFEIRCGGDRLREAYAAAMRGEGAEASHVFELDSLIATFLIS